MELSMIELKEMLFRNSVKTGFEKYVGKNVFIRTVTHHFTGHVTEVVGLSMTLENAAWIADDGRLHDSMRDSNKFSEVEPYVNPITLNIYSFLECTELEGPLPRNQK